MEKKGGQNNVYLETERRWKEGNKHGHGNEKKKDRRICKKKILFFKIKTIKKKMQKQQTNLDGYRFKNNQQLTTFPRQEA